MGPIYIISASLGLASGSSSELIYDLKLNGQNIGHRRVKIEFLPIDSVNPRGGRKLSVWTEFTADFPGQDVIYKQRASALYRPQKPTKFISSSSINGDLLEIQGRQKRNGDWMITYIRPQEIQKKNYSRHQMNGSSLDIFDPEQIHRWQEDKRYAMLPLEMQIDPIQSTWMALKTKSESTHKELISEKGLAFGGKTVDISLNWTHDGYLLNWQLSKGPIVLSASLRSKPKKPTFGEFESLESDDEIKEEEL